jgi:hypothetical protein
VGAVLSRTRSAFAPLQRRRTRIPRLVLALSVLIYGAATWASSADAVNITASGWTQVYGTTGSVNVTPFPAASNTGTVAVSLTGITTSTGVQLNGTAAVAASLCGNFLGNGTPITPAMKAADTTNTYCDTASDILQIVFANATAGASSFNYTLRASGIGSANVQCLAGGQIPCQLGIGSTEGASPPLWAGQINIFGGGGGTTTTTAGATTTTAVGGTTTTTAVGGTTTTTGATTTTTTGGSTTTTTTGGSTTTTAPGATTTTAPPAGTPLLTVAPASGLSAGQLVKVTVTGLEEFNGESVAVTECGNASSSGASLAGNPGIGDCFGADGLGNGQLLLLPVSGGKLETEYPVAVSAIGANGATCTADVSEPCLIRVADVASQGTKLDLQAPISVGGGGGGGTTTTTNGSTSTTASGSSTTAQGSSTTGAAVVKGATATAGKGTLPYTGPAGPSPLLIAAVGLALLDLGWLASSAVRPNRRRR